MYATQNKQIGNKIMANTENVATEAKAAPEMKRVNVNVPADLYDATFDGDRWDQRMNNAEYLEYVLRKHLESLTAK